MGAGVQSSQEEALGKEKEGLVRISHGAAAWLRMSKFLPSSLAEVTLCILLIQRVPQTARNSPTLPQPSAQLDAKAPTLPLPPVLFILAGRDVPFLLVTLLPFSIYYLYLPSKGAESTQGFGS